MTVTIHCPWKPGVVFQYISQSETETEEPQQHNREKLKKAELYAQMLWPSSETSTWEPVSIILIPAETEQSLFIYLVYSSWAEEADSAHEKSHGISYH